MESLSDLYVSKKYKGFINNQRMHQVGDCPSCEEKMYYIGFKKGKDIIDIAHCTNCLYEYEF